MPRPRPRLERLDRLVARAACGPPRRLAERLLWRSGWRLLAGRGAAGWEDLRRCGRVDPEFLGRYAEASVEARAGAGSREEQEAPEWARLPSRRLRRALDATLRGPRAPAWALAWRGLLRRRALDYAGAAGDLESARRAGLGGAALLSWLGEARLQAGDSSGLSLLEAACGRPDAAAWNHAWLGRALLVFGRDPRALAALGRAVALAPGCAWYRAWRGEAARLLGRLGLAQRELDAALRLDGPRGPHEAFIRTWRGLLQLRRRRPRQALAEFRRVLRRRRGYAPALNGLWQAERAAGRRGWRRSMERAFDADPKYAEAWLHSRPDGAPLPFRRWRLGRSFWSALLSGLALHGGGRHEQAQRAFGRALALRPAHPLAALWRARSLCALGRLDESLRALRRATAADPRFARAWGDRGALELLLGRPAAAGDSLERARLLAPTPESLADLAEALRRQGRGDGSRRAWDGACSLDAARARARRSVWRSAR